MKTASIFLFLLWAISNTASASNVTIHYKSLSNDYDGWGLHIWAGKEMVDGEEISARTDFRLRQGTSPSHPLMPDRFDNFGVVFTIPVRSDAKQFSYTITNGKSHHMGIDEWKWLKNKQGLNLWIVENDPKVYRSLPEQYSNTAPTNPNRTIKSLTASAPAILPPPVPKVSTVTAKASVAPAQTSKPAAKVISPPVASKPVAASKPAASTSAVNAKLQGSLNVLKEELSNKNNTIAKLQSALNSTQKINQRLQKDINSKLLDYQALLQLNDKISNENHALKSSNQSLYQQIESADNSKAEQQLLERNQQLEKQLATVNEQLLAVQKTLSKNNSSAQQQQKLQQQLNQLRADRDELQQQNNKLSAHIVELVQRSDSPAQGQLNSIVWWLLAAAIAVFVLILAVIFMMTGKRYKQLELTMNERLKRKEEEVKAEKVYAAAANEKLRKVLHGEAKQRSWAPLPEGLPDNLRKDSA